MTYKKIITANGTRKAAPVSVVPGAAAERAYGLGPVTLCAGCAHADDDNFSCALCAVDERNVGGRNVVFGCTGFVAAGVLAGEGVG